MIEKFSGPGAKARRVVIGHNSQGRSYVEIDELVAPQLAITPTNLLWGLWDGNLTDSEPIKRFAPIDGPYRLADQAGQFMAKIGIFPPQAEIDEVLAGEPGRLAAVTAGLSLPEIASDVPNVLMHETPTIDLVWVLSGEITCVLEQGEVTLLAGDTLIQRSTNHGWTNRGNGPCVLACAMISSQPLAASGD